MGNQSDPVAPLHVWNAQATPALFENTASAIARVGFKGSTTASGTSVTVGASGDDLVLRAGAADRLLALSTGVVRPGEDNTQNLGSSTFRWATIFAGTGTINTSDAREKNAITDSDLGLGFLSALRPVSYRMRDGTSGRTHYGLIAQEVEAALAQAGKGGQDFAGLVVSPVEDESGQPTGEVRYGLRYDQLIAPLIRAVQELAARVEALEADRST